MKLKKIQNNNEINKKQFRFITLDKIEMYSPKITVEKSLINKKKENITNSHKISNRASFSIKLKQSKQKQDVIKPSRQDNILTISNSIFDKNEITSKLNSLLNKKEVNSSKNIGTTNNSSFSLTEKYNNQTEENSHYYMNIKKKIMEVYENKLGQGEVELDDFENSIIERYKKYSPNEYFNKVSNKVFTNLINSDSKNKARINLKNLILYKPHPDYLDKYKPLEFERINLGRNYHHENRKKIIEKYSEITDVNLKNNTNFYERLPFIEDQVKGTINRLNVTKDNYSRLKKIYFGYN